jgi:predicted phage terminase large subunit-like protein
MKTATAKKRGWFSKKPEKECVSTLADLKNIALDEDDLVRSITRQSLFEFTKEFWWEVAPGQPYIGNWHIKYLCDSIQQEVERIIAGLPKEFDYILVNQPPVTLKSTIHNMMLQGWLWARAPYMNFISCSYGEKASMPLAQKARDLVKSERYQRIFPDVRIRGDMDSKGVFGNTAGGIRFSDSIKGGITSKHGHVVMIDDPLDPEEAMSAVSTETAKRIMLQTLANRKKDEDVTPTFVIMQRLSEDDPSGVLLQMAREGSIRLKHICLPAEESDRINPPELRKYYERQGGLLFPARLSRRALDVFKAGGEYFYAGQYMQWPVPPEGGMFKVGHLTKERDDVCPDPTNPRLWVKQVRYWDKAGTNKGGCFTVGVRMGKDTKGRYWVIHVERFQKEAAGREKRIREVAELDGEHVIVGVEQEPGSGGKESANNTVGNLAGFRVIKDNPTGDKTARADTYATQLNCGNVYLAEEGIIQGLDGTKWHRVYIEELMLFPKGKYKDQVDSSSGAFKCLLGNVFQVGFYKGKQK